MNAQNLSTEEADRHEASRQHRANRRYKGEQPIRELHVSRDGRIHTVGDENTPDFDRPALENMRAAIDVDADMQDSLRRRDIAIARATDPLYGTELALDADEWEEIPSPATEVEEESDEDAPETDAEDAIFTSTPRVECKDVYVRLAEAVRRVENHLLVKKYGFSPDSLITDVGGDHPVAMGFDVLAVTLAACQAADELATLAGYLEVCRVLNWTGTTPPALKNFGADRLFHHAGKLQARVKAIRAQLEAAARKVGGIRPRAAVASPPPAPAITAAPRPIHTLHHLENRMTPTTSPTAATDPRPEPGSSARALLARIEAGLEAATRLYSLGTAQLLNRALAAWSQERAEELVEKAEAMLRACEASPLPATQPSPRPAHARPACFGSSGKGASPEQRAKKAARAERDRQLGLAMRSGKK